MFTCIYCLQNEPDVKPSETHIFPDAMGGLTSARDIVCVTCNRKNGRAFEQVEIRKLAFFQSIWGIKNRRGKTAGVRAVLRFEGREASVTLDHMGQPKTAMVIPQAQEDGKKAYSIVGPAEHVEAKRQEIGNKLPSIQWHEMDVTNRTPPETIIPFDSDLSRASVRRLAARVAFERWAQSRGPLVVIDRQYDPIRNFILTGAEPDLRCGVLADSQLLNGMLNFPTGNHAVVILAHPRSQVLGSLVAFYSLFYFWIVLSRDYRALTAFDDLLREDPQRNEVHNPVLRSGTGNLLVKWHMLEKAYSVDPGKVTRKAIQHAARKFQASADKFYLSKTRNDMSEKA